MSGTESNERNTLMQCKPTFDPDGTYSGRLATWTATTRPCTDWQGITCAAWRVTGIDLSAQGLGGSLCFLLRDLSELVTLRFNNNSFTGGHWLNRGLGEPMSGRAAGWCLYAVCMLQRSTRSLRGMGLVRSVCYDPCR
jgi:hypothetical protein